MGPFDCPEINAHIASFLSDRELASGLGLVNHAQHDVAADAIDRREYQGTLGVDAIPGAQEANAVDPGGARPYFRLRERFERVRRKLLKQGMPAGGKSKWHMNMLMERAALNLDLYRDEPHFTGRLALEQMITSLERMLLPKGLRCVII